MNKTVEEVIQSPATKAAPFVGNYNVPAFPFTLPDGTHVQANQLKNTFQRFKRELRDQDNATPRHESSPAATLAGDHTERASFYSPLVSNQSSGDASNILKLAADEREALIQAVRHIQQQKRAA